NRFRDLMGLKYSLRSLPINAPWVRKVFIVTDSQVPTWFNRSYTKDIHFVFHDQFFANKSHVPTFNSESIESNFYNLPDYVGDCFLYFNDDTFTNNKIYPSDFYSKETGQAIYFNLWKSPQEPEILAKSSWHKAIDYTNKLMNSIWGDAERHYNSHTIIMYNKKVLKLMQKTFPKEFALTSANPYRTATEVNLGFMYSHFVKRFYKTFEPTTNILQYHALQDDVEKMDKAFKSIISKRAKTVCLNDELGEPANATVIEHLMTMFETLFPVKPEWE
ncbi:hypothetical protein SAMD00019534_047220, partial [Acytostelium subglobosum LB1]|uniref:hypothetical protein n=1 Tax=Acytostelium subglobosum LB1 TaxID=1410327 RepID=UPI000644E1B6